MCLVWFGLVVNEGLVFVFGENQIKRNIRRTKIPRTKIPPFILDIAEVMTNFSAAVAQL